MKRSHLLIVAIALVMACIPTGATIQPFFHKVDCANGFRDAFMVMVVNTEGGCIDYCWGIDCSGKRYKIDYTVRRVTDPPNLPFTHTTTFTAANGASVFVRVQNVDGLIQNVWGTDATGAYYVAEVKTGEL